MEIVELSCGCIMGLYLCPEAARLWRIAGDAYEQAETGAGTWDTYEAARQAYTRHFQELAMEVQA